MSGDIMELAKLFGDVTGLSKGQVTMILLAIAAYFTVFRPMKKNIEDIKSQFKDLHDATMEIQVHLSLRGRNLLSPVHKLNKLTWVTSNSPFVLNEKGKELYDKSEADTIIQNYQKDLIEKLSETQPNTAYDVEKNAFEVIGEFIQSKEELSTMVKSFIHNNPVFNGKEIDFPDIFFVASIKLRDIYLARHPELNEDKKEVVKA